MLLGAAGDCREQLWGKHVQRCLPGHVQVMPGSMLSSGWPQTVAADLNYAILRVRAALKLGHDTSSTGAVSELPATRLLGSCSL